MTTSDVPGDGSSRGTRTTAIWWVLVARAVLVVALGVVFLVTGRPRPILGNLVAMYWLVSALVTLRWALSHRRERGFVLSTVAAGVGIAAAVLVLIRGLLHGVVSLTTLLGLLAVSFIFTGVMRLLGAFKDEPDEQTKHRLLLRYGLGVTEIAVGVVFLRVDHVGRSVATAAGVWALIGGSVMLLDAIAARRRMGHEMQTPGLSPQ